MHLKMEMLDVTMEITCKVDGRLSENLKMIMHCSANCGSDSNVSSVIFIVLNNFWQCVMVELSRVTLNFVCLVHLSRMAE